ncbi:AAA family ATPase [Variovorax sp. J22R24]|uniref:ATP-binding protein n=1 Tax=Variovorax gracilis TaxID=3053502 RepID=UPI0025782171|nr:AAA family ATPase [Variovorax sp. J22R24]MDM0108437.1 AAA family ATPase [Variovorax sp. J22R24]
MSDQSSHAAPSPRRATRRNLTVVFSDLSDSTALASSMEAEHYAELLGQLGQVWAGVVSRNGGTIVRIQGDGMLAIFGHPEGREDDGRRATEAALDFHEAVTQIRHHGLQALGPLGLHTGIHAGLVLLDEGDLVRGRFELLGNAPNIAARLSDAAERNEILVSEETLGFERQFFRTGERRELRLKGHTQTVIVFPILGRTLVHTRFEAHVQRGLSPFVGRRHELATLQSTLGKTLAGRPGCVAISAPTGVGKTRLIEEFLAHATALECQLHRGYCESYLSAEPMQPFLQMLRSLFHFDHGTSGVVAAASVDQVLAEVQPGLAANRRAILGALSVSSPTASIGDPKRPAMEVVTGAMCELCAALASRRPLVLFIDDWQWADDATSQILNAIRSLDRSAIFVLIATRGVMAGDAILGGAQVLKLPPLSEEEAVETIQHLLPQGNPFMVQEVQKYAGGNPLYIEELCHSAAHGDLTRRRGQLHGGAAWLNAVIESRAARLTAGQSDLVRTAAVIGNVIPSWLLLSLTGYAQDTPVVRSLAEQDFIFPGETSGTLRFKHGITRDVIYQSVGLHEREATHLRIADLIREQCLASGEEEPFEALAYHYGAASQHALAAHYAELAGDKAMDASALDRAHVQYRAALAALDRLEPSKPLSLRWISIAQRLGFASVFDPSRDQLAVFQRALELAVESGEEALVARAHYWLGYFNGALGETRPALHHCTLCFEGAQRIGDDRLTVQAAAALGQIEAASANYDRALELLDSAIAVKRSHRTGVRLSVGLGYTLATKAHVLGDRGEFAQAHECFDEALRAIGGANHQVEAAARILQGIVLLWQGRWEEARQAAVYGCRIAEAGRNLSYFSMGGALSAYASWAMERTVQSLQAMLDAAVWLEPRRSPFSSLTHGWLADAFMTDGRPGARRHAARAIGRMRKGDLFGATTAYRALARKAARSSDLERARHYIDFAMEVGQARQSAHEAAVTKLCRARIEAVIGNRDRAELLLDQALREFEDMSMQWHLTEATALRRVLPR